MTRLTNHTREKIVHELLNRKFDERGKALAARSSELFTLVYEDQYDDEIRVLMKAIEKRKKQAFQNRKRLEVNVGGLALSVGEVSVGTGLTKYLKNTIPRPMLNQGYEKFATYSDCPIAQQLFEFAQDTRAFIDEINEAKRQCTAALSSITTDNKLAELWPEAMAVVAQHIPSSGVNNLPALQFSHLTKVFGLEPAAQGVGA